MNYKVMVAIKGEKLKVRMVSNRIAARDLVLSLVGELHGAYVIGPTSVDDRSDTITVPLFKNNVEVGAITGSPAVSPQRPLTGKFKELKLLMSKADAPFLAKDVIGIINEVMTGKYDMDAMLSPGLTVRDVLSVNGFYTSHEVIEQIAAVYGGRLFREAAKRCGINLEDSLEVSKCVPIMDLSTKLEKAVAKIAVAALIKKHGLPDVPDEAGIQRLMTTINKTVMDQMAQ